MNLENKNIEGIPLSLIEVFYFYIYHINELVQERHNSSVLAMELRLSGTYPAIYCFDFRKSIALKSIDLILVNCWQFRLLNKQKQVESPNTSHLTEMGSTGIVELTRTSRVFGFSLIEMVSVGCYARV